MYKFIVLTFYLLFTVQNRYKLQIHAREHKDFRCNFLADLAIAAKTVDQLEN